MEIIKMTGKIKQLNKTQTEKFNFIKEYLQKITRRCRRITYEHV